MNNILPKSGVNPHGKIIGSQPFQYRVNTQWCQFKGQQAPVENCHDMAFDSKGRLFLVTDHPQNNLIVINPDGTLADAFCTQFPGAHAIRIVQEDDQEFIYLVDSGWKTNRHWDGKSTEAWDSPFNKVIPQNGCIAKLTIDGHVEFIIGHPQTIGIYTPDMPFRPTDIVIGDNSDLYVTDGYGSDFVIQYNKHGQYVRHWGGHENSDTHYNLANTHGIELLSDTQNGSHLLVSSRADMQYKRFTLEGKYIDTIDMHGAWVGRPTLAHNHMFVPVCWSDIDGTNATDSGFVSILDMNFNPIAQLGGTTALVDGEEKQQTTWDLFNHVHGIVVDDDGNLYIGQWRAGNSMPIKLEKC
ncbi:NHL repeat-containing protein [Thalassotalea agarivorans]|uniref:NHL repeat-containing protein n=1 Tax=Thalassotalea agarivorans TaxID=349064 RepID=A0A1I0E0F0_THASX|nr:6-bladed beta-propeller [Thalassotalea agarivorans]SET38070.1 hypothetical protein SAMN05660429_01666 [Thalassotalea agarivorans]